MKANHLFFLGLASLLTTSAVAQSRFSFGVTAAPVLSHSSSRFSVNLPDQNGQINQQIFDVRGTSGGYNVGVPVQYNLTPQWSISSGVWFSQFRSSGTYPFGNGPIPSRIISSSYKVPLLVNYRLTTRRLSPYFSIGAVGSFRGTTLYKPEAGSGVDAVKLTFGSKAVILQPLIGAGVAYRINPHWSLTAQPLLIWRFKPSSNYERFVAYQVNGQVQLLYSL